MADVFATSASPVGGDTDMMELVRAVRAAVWVWVVSQVLGWAAVGALAWCLWRLYAEFEAMLTAF